MSRFHLDTDYLIHALMRRGHEHARLRELFESEHQVELSAMAWYEFVRGPRTPQQVAVARSFFAAAGIIPVTEEVAERAADLFRRLKSSRRRSGDLLIAAVALTRGATLLTRNLRDYADVDGLGLEPAH